MRVAMDIVLVAAVAEARRREHADVLTTAIAAAVDSAAAARRTSRNKRASEILMRSGTMVLDRFFYWCDNLNGFLGRVIAYRPNKWKTTSQGCMQRDR